MLRRQKKKKRSRNSNKNRGANTQRQYTNRKVGQRPYRTHSHMQHTHRESGTCGQRVPYQRQEVNISFVLGFDCRPPDQPPPLSPLALERFPTSANIRWPSTKHLLFVCFAPVDVIQHRANRLRWTLSLSVILTDRAIKMFKWWQRTYSTAFHSHSFVMIFTSMSPDGKIHTASNRRMLNFLLVYLSDYYNPNHSKKTRHSTVFVLLVCLLDFLGTFPKCCTVY